MSVRLYEQVARLFALLDLDGNGKVDRMEARLGFTACFSDVHRSSEALGSPATVIDQQVQWLFAATSHADAEAAEVSPDEFKACYTKLLHASYEEEVLLIDLQRAIDSLSNGDEWTQSRKLLAVTKQIFQALLGGSGSDEAAEVQPTQPRVQAVLQRLFAGIQGRSQVLGPKKQTAARRIVAPLFPEQGGAANAAVAAPSIAAPAAAAASAASAAAPASASSSAASAAAAAPLTLVAFQRLFKTLLALPVPASALLQDAEAALLLATGDSASSAPAAAATSSDMQTS